MLLSSRSALLIFTALSASSVAPAQVGTTTEPMAIGEPMVAANTIPTRVIAPLPLAADAAPAVDPLAPLPESDAGPDPVAESAQHNGDLPALVARLRSADPGSRELECLAVGIYFES